MDKTQSSRHQIVNWECLPESTTLLEYLDRDSVIVLSMCCKRYRKQFEKVIFYMLNLTRYLDKNSEVNKALRKSKDYEGFAQGIKKDLDTKLNLVRKFKFCELFCLKIASNIVGLLPNITSIVFDIPYCLKCLFESLTFLNSMKNLEHIEYEIYNHLRFNRIHEKLVLPRSLKSINIYGSGDYLSGVFVFDDVNSSYANLTTISIPTNKMLVNFTPAPSLKEVEILFADGIDKTLLVEFFKKNPQLKKIKLYYRVFDELLQTILSFKYLNCLSIYNRTNDILEDIHCPHNYSIKKLELGPGY